VYIYGSYRKIKTGVLLFWTTCTLFAAGQVLHLLHRQQQTAPGKNIRTFKIMDC